MDELTQQKNLPIVEKLIVLSRKNNNVEGKPGFGKLGVIFYRIPRKFRSMVKAGEMWTGNVSKPEDTTKKDRRGITIYVCNFIPIERVERVEQSENDSEQV